SFPSTCRGGIQIHVLTIWCRGRFQPGACEEIKSSRAQSGADEVLKNELKQKDDARERHNQEMEHDDDDDVVEVVHIQPLRSVEATRGRDTVAQAMSLPTRD
ncbi:hypothetical protein Tco_1311495, partial [Tanacetum coccineum]